MRLIDADKYKEDLWAGHEYLDEDTLLTATNILDCQPTIEAEPVRHGRWVTQWCDNNMIGHEYAECSVCGCSMLDTNQFWNSKYCPNCGAKMDGDFE